jgi:hypothetical protein
MTVPVDHHAHRGEPRDHGSHQTLPRTLRQVSVLPARHALLAGNDDHIR